MKNFVLHNVLPGSEKDFSNGTYIILFNTSSVPPHLLLSVHGKIYSITDAGRQLGSPLEKLIGFIKRKKVPSLFVEIALEKRPGFDAETFQMQAKNHFMKYEKVIEGKVSCLFPIRNCMADLFGDEMKKAGFIFELLPMMEKINGLRQNFELNMENKLDNGSFELLTYTNEQLKEALQSTQNANQS